MLVDLLPRGIVGLENGAAFILAVIGGVIVYNHEKQRRLKKLMSNKFFMFSLIPVALWSYMTLAMPNTWKSVRFRDATKSALVAFIVAICAYLELTIAPFWIVWLFSFYLNTIG